MCKFECINLDYFVSHGKVYKKKITIHKKKIAIHPLHNKA
jgi:hypothetical protein